MIGLFIFAICGFFAIVLAGWMGAAVFGGIFFVMVCAALRERHQWGGGHCRCGHRWRMFDMDSQGGRMYKCDACGSYVDVSYPFVDGMIG